MELKILKVTKKNGQAWITCGLAGRNVALIHVIDSKLADSIHNPISITIDQGDKKEVCARLIKRTNPVPSDKELRFRGYDALFGNRDHTIPKQGSRTKGNAAAWNQPPYSHLQG